MRLRPLHDSVITAGGGLGPPSPVTRHARWVKGGRWYMPSNFPIPNRSWGCFGLRIGCPLCTLLVANDRYPTTTFHYVDRPRSAMQTETAVYLRSELDA
jgi:hypothetical protein